MKAFFLSMRHWDRTLRLIVGVTVPLFGLLLAYEPSQYNPYGSDSTAGFDPGSLVIVLLITAALEYALWRELR